MKSPTFFRVVLTLPLVVLVVLLTGTLGDAAHLNPVVIASISSEHGSYSGVGVNPQTNRIYAVKKGSSTGFSVDVIDGTSHRVLTTISLSYGEAAGSVAVNPTTGRVYVVDAFTTTLSIIDGNTETLVKSIDSEDGVGPIGVVVDPKTNRVYQVEATGVKVLDGRTDAVIETIPVEPVGSLRDAALNPVTNRLYVTGGNIYQVYVIDTARNALISKVSIDSPSRVAVNPATDRLYVASDLADMLSVMDGTTGAVVATIAVPRGSALVVDSVTNRIYAGGILIDGATNEIITTIPECCGGPGNFAVNQVTDRVYFAGGRVAVIADSPSSLPDQGGAPLDEKFDLAVVSVLAAVVLGVCVVIGWWRVRS